MASSGDGEPVQYLYTPDMDESMQMNPMLTHQTNILNLDNLDGNPSTAAQDSRYADEDYADGDLIDGELDNREQDIEVSTNMNSLYLQRSHSSHWASSSPVV